MSDLHLIPDSCNLIREFVNKISESETTLVLILSDIYMCGILTSYDFTEDSRGLRRCTWVKGQVIAEREDK